MWHENHDLLAYHDLDGRSGLKLALQEVEGHFDGSSRAHSRSGERMRLRELDGQLVAVPVPDVRVPAGGRRVGLLALPLAKRIEQFLRLVSSQRHPGVRNRISGRPISRAGVFGTAPA